MSQRLNRSFLQIAGPMAIAAMALTAAPAAQQQHSTQQDQQQAQAQQQDQPSLLTSSQVDDQTLEQFTRAYLEVVPIQRKLKEDLAGATDAAQKKQIQQDANAKMVKAIKDHQETVKTFNQILKSINKDQTLSKRFVAMEEKVQKS